MPRSGATYTLPAGYLATTGETATATQHNSPLTDIATALTNSVSRDGAGQMTGTLTINGGGLTTTGNITIDSASSPSLNIDKGSASDSTSLAFKSAGANQWLWQVPANGDLLLYRYLSGVYQDTPITVTDTTGDVTIANDLTVAGDLNVTGSVSGVTPTTFATATQFRDDTAGSIALSPAVVWDAAERVSLTSSSNSVAWDMSSGINFELSSLGENTTIANPTNAKVGQSGFLWVSQDASGGRTISWGSNYLFAGGTAPTATATANAYDVFLYVVLSTNDILITSVLDIS